MLKFSVIFIDGVVSQVNEHIVNIGIVEAARLEFLSGESDDPFVV
jgi:hypothetical protein